MLVLVLMPTTAVLLRLGALCAIPAVLFLAFVIVGPPVPVQARAIRRLKPATVHRGLGRCREFFRLTKIASKAEKVPDCGQE
jgi:hypothetical protein